MKNRDYLKDKKSVQFKQFQEDKNHLQVNPQLNQKREKPTSNKKKVHLQSSVVLIHVPSDEDERSDNCDSSTNKFSNLNLSKISKIDLKEPETPKVVYTKNGKINKIAIIPEQKRDIAEMLVQISHEKSSSKEIINTRIQNSSQKHSLINNKMIYFQKQIKNLKQNTINLTKIVQTQKLALKREFEKQLKLFSELIFKSFDKNNKQLRQKSILEINKLKENIKKHEQKQLKQNDKKIQEEETLVKALQIQIVKLKLKIKQMQKQTDDIFTNSVNEQKQHQKQRQKQSLLIKSLQTEVKNKTKQVQYYETQIKKMQQKNDEMKEQFMQTKIKNQRNFTQSQNSTGDEKININQQISKLKTTLKLHENQAEKHEEEIFNLNYELKSMKEENEHGKRRFKEANEKYQRKLQQFDSALVELQKDLEASNQGCKYKLQQTQFLSKQAGQIDRMKKQLMLQAENVAFQREQNFIKERQLEQLKVQYERRFVELQWQEEGLKAEYNVAIKTENATRDKFYNRYHQFFSPQRQRNHVLTDRLYHPEREQSIRSVQLSINPYQINTFRPKAKGKVLFSGQETDKYRMKNILSKAKSQREIRIGSPRKQFIKQRIEMDVSRYPPTRDFTKLTSKINLVRDEIDRELRTIYKD